MDREQAKNILNAYLYTCYAVDADGKCSNTDAKKAQDILREIILDAMTSCKSTAYVSKYPSITLPADNTGILKDYTYIDSNSYDA